MAAEGYRHCGTIAFEFMTRPLSMPLTVTVQPAGRSFAVERDEPILAAAIRQGIGLPYGCKDGACGTCKSRLLEGRVIHGTHQHKALSVQEEEAGWMLTCCAAPQTDVVIEARVVPGAGDFPVRKMPMPRDDDRARGARRRDHQAAAAGQRPPAVPRRAVRRVHPARPVAPQLLDGQRAAHARRAARHRAAPAPHAGRQVHRSRVRRHEGKGNPAHGRAVRQLLPARGLRQADHLPGQRAPASRRSRRSSITCASSASGVPRRCTGVAAARPTCTSTTGACRRRRRCRT